MNLRDYIKNEAKNSGLGTELFIKKFAQELGVTRGGVYKWFLGHRIPSVSNAIKIAKYTNNLVTLEECFCRLKISKKKSEGSK